MVKLFDLVELGESINLMDVGAAAISEVPIYRSLIDLNM